MNTTLTLRIAALSAVLFTGSLTAQCFYIPDNDPAAGTCNIIPFGTTKPSPTWENQKYQTIVPISQITTGTITGLGFAACGAQTRTMDSIIITMGQNPSGALGTTFAANLVNNVQVVLNRSTLFTYDCGAGNSWADIDLDSAYTVLPGLGDLVIDIEIVGNDRIAGTGSGFHRFTSTGTNRLQSFGWPTGTPPAAGTLDSAPAKMRICFGTYYGVPDLNPTGPNGNSIPLGSFAADMRYQTIVTPADLGNQASMINAIAFSAHTASVALSRTYTLLEIRLAHSTSPVLDPTFANNLQSPVGGALVYSGVNVTIDWLVSNWKDINLQTPFPYNGTDNLIVEITTNGNTGAGSTFHWRDTRPRLYASGIAPVTGTTSSSALKMRFCTSCRSASVSYRGVGCGPGLNIRAGLPVIGTSVPFSLYNGPASGPGFVLFGLDAGAPYPVDLSGIGMSNCLLYQGVLLALPTSFSGGTTSPVFFGIPNNPNFCLFTLYAQGGAIWPGANPAGIVLSDQAVCEVGV